MSHNGGQGLARLGRSRCAEEQPQPRRAAALPPRNVHTERAVRSKSCVRVDTGEVGARTGAGTLGLERVPRSHPLFFIFLFFVNDTDD